MWFTHSKNGSSRFETFETHQVYVKLPYSAGANRFKTFETHHIYVKLPYSAGLLVVRTFRNTLNSSEPTF